tara:strand:+ start:1635 stop:1823 length:189 start_codon:yes stop_codon:yes gene_type:complete
MSEGENPSSLSLHIMVHPIVTRELRINGIDINTLTLKKTRVGLVYICPIKKAPRRLSDARWI